MFKQDYKVSKGGNICAQTVGKFWHPAKYIKQILTQKKIQKTVQKNRKKWDKIMFIDFTAQLKSCSTKTKFHNFFK